MNYKMKFENTTSDFTLSENSLCDNHIPIIRHENTIDKNDGHDNKTEKCYLS